MSVLSELLKNYAPQNGWGTFFTAAFGAFAGAFAASRAHNKRTIVAELNAVNAAHELSVAIANMFLAFKRQHVVPLKEDFERIKAAYNNHKTMLQNGVQGAQPFHFTADLRSLSVLATPQAALEKMIFEKTLVRGRALAALVTLVAAIDGVGITIRARNEMVEDRRKAQWNDQERLEFFLGLRTSAGVQDERFKTNIAGIVAQTDDCIFFARILATDLAQYSNRLKPKEGRFYRLRVPNIDETDWSYPEKMGLMPKDTDCENWLRGFRRPEPSRWQRLLAYVPFLKVAAKPK
jgi:hypothetical protein